MTLCNAIALSLLSFAPSLAREYRLGPDSLRQAGVPQGKVTRYSWASKIYPGTTRDYWVYMPAQYRPDRPAAVMVFLDGSKFMADDDSWHVPIVFDNLIHRGDMPVTIGIFIDPGVLPARIPNEPAHSNRSFEYDAVTSRYSRFLLEEILPEVARSYKLSADPNDRAIAGSSSGGTCAFTVAWDRPEAFHRVLSFVGSFTNLRGAEIYPSLIRKTEPKPIRVFLQDGEKDLNVAAGNWFIGAHDMVSALEYAGYDVAHAWGTEAHNSKHGASILPDTLRWLWRGYPAPIPKPKGGNGERQWSVLLTAPGEDWEVVTQVPALAEGLVADKDGDVFYSDSQSSRIYKIGINGKISLFKENSNDVRALAFGPGGRLYAYQGRLRRMVAYAVDGKETVVATNVDANDLEISARGNIYFTDPPHKRVWSINASGRRMAYEGIQSPTNVCLSPDQAFLIVDDSADRGVRWFQIQPDGSLADGDSLYRLELPDEPAASGATGMAVDTDGFLYVATKMGIQVFDPPGRVMAILDPPSLSRVSSIVFGGPNHDVLYAIAGDKVFKRHMRHRGVVASVVGRANPSLQ